MELTSWSMGLALSKWLSHIAMVSLLGSLLVQTMRGDDSGHFEPWLIRIRRQAAGLGVLASIAYIFLQLGSLNEMGMAGMFDLELAQMLLPTAMGLSLVAKVVLFACAWLWYQSRTLVLLCTLLLAASVTMTGHLAEAHWLVRLVLAAHLVLVGCWVGSLYPLYRLTWDLPAQDSYPVLHKFGLLMQWLLGLILVSGALMIWQLLAGQWQWTSYTWLLAAKISLVALMMLQGAWHRWWLVPALQQGHKQALLKSLRLETGLGLSILLFTSLLTSITGPFQA